MFGSLKIYEVYLKTGSDSTLEDAVFVPQGFSVLALILGFIWALLYRIWWLAGVGAIFYIASYMLINMGVVGVITSGIIEAAFSIWIGLNARDWHGDVLLARGYTLMGVVSGRTEGDAQQRFFDNYVSNKRSPGGLQIA